MKTDLFKIYDKNGIEINDARYYRLMSYPISEIIKLGYVVKVKHF